MKNFLSKISFFLLMPLLAFSAGYEEIKDENTLKILNPTFAKRKTAKLRLTNGLEAYLISDPETKQSGAALSVEVGSWHDPEKYPGMAHFLEHMLFMGTKAYPQENEYWNYIADNSGNVNAFTSADRTVYIFSVSNEGFLGALDRFSHFFIDPLFLPSCINRELLAVDQEHAKNIENDAWREWMVFKEMGNPLHPNVKFSTGNAKTLGGIPQKEMINWYKNQYSADRMHLVVLSTLPIENLIESTVQSFSPVPNAYTTSSLIKEALTSSKQQGHFLYINPIQNCKTLAFMWEIPAPLAINQEKMAPEITQYVLSRKTENSLEAQLKRENVAESVKIVFDKLAKGYGLFSIEINLTEAGLSKVDLVTDRVFQTIAGLKEQGISSDLFREMKKIYEIEYQYQSRDNAFIYCQKHAWRMAEEPLSTYPQKTLIPTEYDPNEIQEFLNLLQPQTCLYTVKAPKEKMSGIQLDKKEQWMGVEYTIKPIVKERLLALENISSHPKIGLPSSNPYIPTNLKLVHGASEKKISTDLLFDDEFAKIYFSPDTKYQVPQTAVFFNFKTPFLDGSPKSKALADLLLKNLNDKLSPVISLASSAGFDVEYFQNDLNFTLIASGYSETLPNLLKDLLKNCKNLKPSKEKFKNYKEALSRNYQNNAKKLALQQSMELMQSLLFDTRPHSLEKDQELETISYREYLDFANQFLQTAYVEGLIYGNITQNESAKLWNELKSLLKYQPYPALSQKNRHILSLSSKHGPHMIVRQTPMQGNSALLLLQQGSYSPEAKGIQRILSTALKEEFFNTLRTKQQTAYIAKSWDMEEERQLMQFFAVQSNSHHPSELIPRFELLLENYVKDFSEKISEERFEQIRSSVIKDLEMAPENLFRQGMQLFSFAFDYQGDFSHLDKEVEALKKLQYDQFAKTSKEFLSRENTKRLAILIEGASSEKKPFRYAITSQENLDEIGDYISYKE
ncbi:MAG: insulinase family protein [Chlamydiae bacterium]|nr:insulinase family protein [Chlamydiota bacterium]